MHRFFVREFDLAYAIVIGGLEADAFNRIKQESENRIAPGGKVIIEPNKAIGSYAKNHAASLISKLHTYAKSLHEAEKFSVMLLYVDYEDRTTQNFIDNFFPFALPLSLHKYDLSSQPNKKTRNETLNGIATEVLSGSLRLRERSRLISSFTDIHNLTPVLLPRENFRCSSIETLLRELFCKLAADPDPEKLVRSSVAAFFAQRPRVFAPGQDRHCFCDGQLFFQSPGKHRHGFFRLSGAHNHSEVCLLNARSRVGGSYDYKFHYDCIPTKGSLKSQYPDCHGEGRAPKSTHVNIAPNDYIV